MATPTTPELDQAQAQQALLQQINGDDWNTNAGATVALSQLGENAPALHIYLESVEFESVGRAGSSISDGLTLLTWAAIVPVTDDDDLLSLKVLADMRCALTHDQPRISIQRASIARRESGSSYAVVSVTTAVHTPTR